MAIYRKIKTKQEEGKSSSPALLHGKITTCRAGRPRNIIMGTEGRRKK